MDISTDRRGAENRKTGHVGRRHLLKYCGSVLNAYGCTHEALMAMLFVRFVYENDYGQKVSEIKVRISASGLILAGLLLSLRVILTSSEKNGWSVMTSIGQGL